MIKLPYETPEFRIALTENDIRTSDIEASGDRWDLPEVEESDN